MTKRRLPLTLDKAGKRWAKFYRGQRYRFPIDQYPTVDDAWEAWLTKKAQVDIDHQAKKPNKDAYHEAIQARRNLAHYCRTDGDIAQAKIFEAEAEALLGKFNRSPSPPNLTHDEADPLSSLLHTALPEWNGEGGEALRLEHQRAERELRIMWGERLRQYQKPDSPTSTTIQATIESFLRTKRNKLDNGELSASRFARLRKHLWDFRDWMGGGKDITQITSKLLVDWHSNLAEQKISPSTAQAKMICTKQFIKWAWELELLDLPRKLHSKDLTFQVSPKSITTYTLADIHTLYNGASNQTKTYIALALNCGMTQRDISDLLQDEVDLEAGTIIRKRSKTKNHVSVPTVKYKLWEPTIKLLGQHQSKDPILFFLNRNGQKLVREWIADESGKHRKSDTVRSAFSRLARKTKRPPVFKRLRKTGATLLDSHPIYRSITHLYLGHSPRSIQERHYTAPPQALLDEAMGWLYGQLFPPPTPHPEAAPQ